MSSSTALKTLFILSVACSLFEPEISTLNYLSIPFYLLFIAKLGFLFFAIKTARLFKSNIFSKRKFAWFLLGFFFISTQQIFQLISFNLKIYDVIKVLLFFIPLLLFSELTDNTKAKFEFWFFVLAKTYILLTLTLLAMQIVNPELQIWFAFGETTHVEKIGTRPFGFIGNPTHAGFIGLVLFIFFLPRDLAFSSFCFILLLIHGNKASILWAIFWAIFWAIRVILAKKPDVKILIALTIFSFLAVVVIPLTPIPDFIARLIEHGTMLHTIGYRKSILDLTIEQYLDNPIVFFLLGNPDQTNWPTFDSMWLLLSWRYGIVGFFVFAGLCIFSFSRYSNVESKLFRLLLLFSGMTMSAIYHIRLAFLAGVILALYENLMWKKPRTVRRKDFK